LFIFFFVFCEIGFEPFCKFAAGKHDAPPASLAFKPYVRAETCDGPFVGATWMLFAKAKVVIEAQVREHDYNQG
jgi:hypothetical protein